MTKYTIEFDDSQKVVSVTYNYLWENVEVEANSEEEAKQKALQMVKDGEVEHETEESNGRENDESSYELRQYPPMPKVGFIQEAGN